MPVTGSITLYAKWEEIPETSCTVTFNTNGGTGGTATALPVGAGGEVLTSDGTTASWAAPAAQPGDHLVKASATDASDPGSLNDKIAVLSPVTKNTIITPQGDEKLLLGIGTSGVTDGYVLTKG